MIVGIIVALAVTLTQLGQLGQTGREIFPGIRGWAAIPTIAVFTGMLAMMGSANVEMLQGRTVTAGVAIGAAALVLMGIVKLLEVRRQRS